MTTTDNEYVIRKFHPVGQGAFFTETFRVLQPDGSFANYSIAYDCGSSKSKYGKEKFDINAYIRKSNIETIDALFLSHLDNDHCNGLKSLFNRYKIKHIFLPLMSPNEKALSLLKHLSRSRHWTGNDNQTLDLIFEPEKIVETYSNGECKLHFVKTNLDSPNEDNLFSSSLENSIFIDNIKKNIEFGKSIRFTQPSNNSKFINWFFIPWNFEFKNRQDKLIRCMENLPLIQLYIKTNANKQKEIDVEQLKIDLQTCKRDILIKILKYCYKCCGGTNENSMVLFSGFLDNKTSSEVSFWGYETCDLDACCRYNKIKTKGCKKSCSPSLRKTIYDNTMIPSGCLYLGDINIKKLPKGFWEHNPFKILRFFIGLYQQPHHGADSSFHKSLINHHSPRLTFMNYGIINSFNHPRHCSDIKNNGITTFHVTENCDFIEIICII